MVESLQFPSFLEKFITLTYSYHVLIETVLFIVILSFIFKKKKKPEAPQLSEEEIQKLIDDWNPEPLVPETPQDHYALNPKTITGKFGKFITVDGKKCLNLATHNYLGLAENEMLEKAALDGLDKYGVGSCGPRGFYGTVDIHLKLEEGLAKFMGVEEAILYSYGFSTIASAIPAYAKVGDVIFADQAVNFAIQKGLSASRSKIKFFKHNDTQDLERLCKEQEMEDQKNMKKAKTIRRFLVVEGIYMNYGDICPLKEIIEIKNKYKIRLFVDESISLGVIGKTGRGVTEYFGVDIDEIDLISASLENTFSAYGGFCCGTTFIVDHQRLSGLGYCFSASLPPLQAAVALEALSVLDGNPDLLTKLRDNCIKMDEILKKIEVIAISGDKISPVKHLSYAAASDDRRKETKRLENICDYAIDNGYALTVARYLDKEEASPPPPSIRLIVSATLTSSELEEVGKLLSDAFQRYAF